MFLRLQFFDSLLVLRVLNLGDLWSCELIHPSNTASNLFLVLSLHGFELKLLFVSLFLQVVLQNHFV